VREHDEARCWEAVERTTCAACLDRGDDGRCRVPARGADCPLRSFFTLAIDVVQRVHSNAMDPYVAALESDVCQTCGELGPGGTCTRRDRGECALYAYLPLTVEAIEEALPA
jgi:hypothetical protein